MKQTAVEWLEEQFNNPNIPNSQTLFNQAKEMEKEQIVEAYDKGYEEGYRDNGKFGFVYFNETFKSE